MHIFLSDQDAGSRDEILRYLQDRFGPLEVVEPDAPAPEHGSPDLIVAPGPAGSAPEPDTVARGPGESAVAGALLDAMSVPAGYIDANLTVRYCNLAAARLLERSVEEVAGQSLRDIIPHYPAIGRAVEGVLKSGEPHTHTLWATPPSASDPAERGYRVAYRPHRSAGGQVIGCFVEAEDVTDHVLAVAELEQNAARLRDSLETLLQGVVICDEQGRIVRMNARAEQLLGDRAAILGTPLSGHFQGIDAQWGDGAPVTTSDALPHMRALRGETLTGVIMSWQVDRDAGRQWVSLSAAPVTDRNGRVTAAVISLTDLPPPLYAESMGSDLEQAAVEVEELTIELEAQNVALQESAESLDIERQQLQAVLSALPVGVWIADRSGRLIQKNREADRIWAGDAPLVESVKAYTWYTAWDTETGEALSPEDYPVAEALSTGERIESVELRIQRQDGTEGVILASAAPVKDREGRLIGAVGVNVDIIERKRVERALRESEEKFYFVARHIPDTVFFQDRDLRYVWIFNPAHPFEEDWMVGKTDAEISSPEEARRLADIKREVLETRRGTRMEMELNVDGEVRWYDAAYEPWYDGGNRLTGVVSYARDITSRKRAEEALRRYAAELEQANEAVRLLLQEVNHRVKNNLTAILGLILAEQRRLDATACRDTGEADGEAGACAPTQAALDNLAERVRSLATAHTLLSAGGWRPLPVDELVEAVVRAAAPAVAEPESVVLEVSGASPEVTPEQAHHLALVISELTTNALKHGRGEEQNYISVEIGLENGDVRLVFHNRGPGYSEAVLAGEGRSVGLEIVEKLVTHSLRGTWAVCNDNGGPVTEIRFPIDPELKRRTEYESTI